MAQLNRECLLDVLIFIRDSKPFLQQINFQITKDCPLLIRLGFDYMVDESWTELVWTETELRKYNPLEILYAIEMLIQEKFIIKISGEAIKFDIMVGDLTLKGHDYLEKFNKTI